MASLIFHNNENSGSRNSCPLLKQKDGIRQTKSLKTAPCASRTFGDISNQIKDNFQPLDNTQGIKKNITSGLVKNEVKDDVVDYDAHFDGPEFRPEIKEQDDVDDILPPSLRLNQEQMTAFVDAFFGRYNHRVRLPSPDISLPSLRITEGLELLPERVSEESPVLDMLEEDHVFDIPPPLWD